MNKRMILYIQGAILLIEAAIMVLPIAAALIYREPSGICRAARRSMPRRA